MGSSAGAIKAGRAFVELFVDDNPAYRALDRFGGKFRSWGGTMQRMGASLGAGGGGILVPLLTGLKEATSRASQLQLVADRIGESVLATSTLAGGFERVGVTAEQFAGIIEGLKVRIEDAADSHGYLHEQIKSMGPAARLAGRETREQLYAVADAIQGMTRINQTRAAKDLGLTPILDQLRRGRAGIDELYASGAAGAVSAAEGAAALEATKAMTAGWTEFKDAVRAAGMALLPTAETINEWREQLRGGVGGVREWIKEHKGVIVTAAGVGVGLTAAGVAVVALGITTAVVGKAMILSVVGVKLAFGAILFPIFAAKTAVVGFGLTTVMVSKGILLSVAGVKLAFGLLLAPIAAVKIALGLLLAPLAAVLSPVGLVTAGIVAVGAGLVYLVGQSEAWQTMLRDMRADLAYLGEGLVAFGARAKETFGGLRDAAGAGDWALAWQIGLGALKAEWLNFTLFFEAAWVAVKEVFADSWADTVAGVKALFAELANFLGRVVGGAVKALIQGFANIAGAVDEDLGNSLRSAASSLPTGEAAGAARDRIMGERDADRAATAAERNAGLDATARAREAARGELAGLNALARWRREFADMPWLTTDDEDGPASPAAAFNGRMRLADTVKGVGIGQDTAIGQQLAFGDSIPQQQLDAQRNIMGNTASLPQMAADVNRLAAGGRLGR